MPIFMKFEGIEGQVTYKGLEKQIELHSASYSTHSAMEGAAHGNRSPDSMKISEINVTKYLDASSVDLFKAQADGKKPAKVEISFTANNAGDENFVYLKYELEDVYITSMSTSGGSGDRPMESLALNFAKITINYTPTDKTGEGSPKRGGYDVVQNKKI